MNKRLILYSPVYCRNSAGIYALYKLASDLKERGNIVFTTIWNANYVMPSIMGVPIIPNIVAKQLIDDYNFSVLYPETISGNPLNAKNTVRWVMNKPGIFKVGDIVFNKDEKLLMYGKEFNQYIDKSNESQIIGELTLPTIDVDLFKYDPTVEKTDITIYTGKQEYRDGYIDKYDNLITRTTPSREEIASILKRTKVLYSFDCVTNIVNEARLCGCEVVFIPNSEQSLNIENNEYSAVGLNIYSKNLSLTNDYDNINKHMVNGYDKIINNYKRQLIQFIEKL